MSDAKYFQTTKKGEVRELQDDLNSVDKIKIKEAVKKVIAAMTVGKDVSMLFSDVIKSMGTENIELKKLIYLYIINYARSQPEKAILVVNMFQKDATNHPNPLVRALAIRTMGCIRVDRITEHLCDPLARSLKDQDPYVRKTAAICVAKLYDVNRELVEERDFITILRDMLSDVNPMVVANAVAALTEICEASGKDYFKIDTNTLLKLLTALNECTEWGRVFILDALAKFAAPNPNVALDICDRVVPQLQHANSAVVMAAVKVIIKFLDILEKQDQEKFCKKLAPPLVTLLSAQPEIQYVALRNIDLIVQKWPKILRDEIRVFFVKFNDAVYVKLEKLEILIKLANRKNVDQVLLEFKEYAQEIDVEFVRKAVRAIGRVAIKLEDAAEKCVRALSELVKTRVNYVVQESVIVIKDIFRRYPHRYEKIIKDLCENLDSLDEPEAKASMIWIIGEYAERIKDAADRLEAFIETFEQEPPMVQLQLLTATVKLFLKKPDESKDLVQKVLNLATENSDNPDLRDRGYVYWRLLSTDPAAARAVVLAERPVISAETFGFNKEYLGVLLEHISTLASVYHRPPNEFVRGHREVAFRAHEGDDDDDGEGVGREMSEESNSGRGRGSGHDSENEEKKDSKKKKKKIKKKKKKKENEDEDEDEEEKGNNNNNDEEDYNDNYNEKDKDNDNNEDVLEAVPQVAQQEDLLGGILADLTVSSNDNNNNKATPQDPADFFDVFGPPSNNNININNGPPLKLVLDSQTGEGLELAVGYKQSNGQPIMIVQAANKSNVAISRIDLKFNKNYLGIQPSQTLPLQGTLNSGASQRCELPLNLSGETINVNPIDTKVQMAERSTRANGVKPPVHVFADDVPIDIFFNPNNNVDKTQFTSLWKNISDLDMQLFQSKQMKNKDVESVKSVLAAKNFFFIAPREIPNKGMSLYFASNLKNTAILSEISIANHGACRIAVKSEDKYLASVTCHMLSKELC